MTRLPRGFKMNCYGEAQLNRPKIARPKMLLSYSSPSPLNGR
jgi:hypothetical protein